MSMAFVLTSAHARSVPEPPEQQTRRSAGRLACVRGDVGFLREVLPDLVGEDATPGEPRLIHFAVYGGPSVLELLAEHGELELEARDRDGSTPLMLAAVLPKAGPAGANPDELEAPLSEIVGAQSCRWLLGAGAQIDARDPQGFSALHWAARAGRPISVAALLQARASVDMLDHRGRTPLMLALLERRSAASDESIELLLRAGADADIRDDHGWTSLHHLAAGGLSNQRVLARQLLARGAQPSRDRAGRSPADISAVLQASHKEGWLVNRSAESADGLDARTAVAAGPGPYRFPIEPTLVSRLLDQLVPEQPDPSRANPTRKARAALDDWQVWGDWLQSHADARGELVSTSLACVGLGGRKRRRMLETLAHVGLRAYSTSHAGLHCADALAPARRTPLQLRWTHGFLTSATIHAPFYRLAPTQVPEMATVLLMTEPLLAELRIHLTDDALWPAMIAALARMPPCPRLRRLVLQGLPATLPNLDELARNLPAVRSLWLIGQGKLHSGRVHWPGPKHLRLRHGVNSEWTRGNVDLALDMPDLTHLDLALPRGSRTVDEEINGSRRILDMLDGIQHLRLCPLDAYFAMSVLASPTIERLRTLELVSVRGSALEVVVARAETLRRLARVRVNMVPAVAEQRPWLLERLRQELPNLELDIIPGKRQPFVSW
jgi:ankyrin repeat protein